MNRSKFTGREAKDGTSKEFKSHDMGMQVSRSMDTEILKEEDVWRYQAASRWSAPGISETEGV